jgi:ubiquinone/menaquinone biosynthesis C-methylase UbiE
MQVGRWKRVTRVSWLLIVVVVLNACAPPREVPSGSDEDTTTSAADSYYEYREGSDQGTGKFYMGREIAPVMGHRGANWLERPEREETELPSRVVRAMDLQPSDVVADLGAGTGYFTLRIAPEVPNGRVYAVDIQPEMLSIIREHMKKRELHNIKLVRGAPDDPKLPDSTLDAALMVDAYHEFSHPREMMVHLKEALKPGGKVYLVEYLAVVLTVPIKPLHKMTEQQAKKEMTAVGLHWRRTMDVLPQQHLMVFQRPMP